jgi:short-subunit dehydrogenase
MPRWLATDYFCPDVGFKRRKGFVVNFCSIGGLVSFPVTGYYHATKYASLSESLWQEVEPLSIKVMVVEPIGLRAD